MSAVREITNNIKDTNVIHAIHLLLIRKAMFETIVMGRFNMKQISWSRYYIN